MAKLLKGGPVTENLKNRIEKDVAELNQKGIEPTLLTLRVGERPDDISYESSVTKKAMALGLKVINKVLPETTSQEELDSVIEEINEDEKVHGALMFRPLPKHLNSERARNMLLPSKDVDGMTDGSLAGVFTDKNVGFPPCTAEAVMEILNYYDIELQGKTVVVMGRSLVIGKPVAMMLLKKNATVTICHSKTKELAKIASKADVLISAMGKLNFVDKEFTNPDQVIIDVGINWNEEQGKISGDCKFDEVEQVVDAITPVPGGVGGVTSMIMISHVVEAAKDR